MIRRGVWMFPGVAAGRLVDAVVAAEAAGLDEVWIADEGVARDPMPVLAAAAGRTERIRLGVGITSPLLRHPGAIAATAATLDELSDGRAVLGLGVGGGLSLDPFGLHTERPVGVVADAIRLARGVLGVTAVTGRVTYDPPAHAMPARAVPIWVGARGPQLVRLAAAEADGLFLSGCGPDELERIVPAVHEFGRAPELALYHSASDHDTRASVSPWDRVGHDLAAMAARWHPAAVGVNLVQLASAETSPDPVVLVHRAAGVLADIA